MKQTILIALFALLGTANAFAQKFGHLDAQSVLFELPENVEIQASLESTASEYQGEILRMQQELETKVLDYEAKAATWPDAIRQQKEKEFQQMSAGLQEFQMTAQNDITQMEQQLLAPMIERVRKAIQDVGAEHGFTYIFDTSTAGFVYTGGGEDVTELVKTKLGM